MLIGKKTAGSRLKGIYITGKHRSIIEDKFGMKKQHRAHTDSSATVTSVITLHAGKGTEWEIKISMATVDGSLKPAGTCMGFVTFTHLDLITSIFNPVSSSA